MSEPASPSALANMSDALAEIVGKAAPSIVAVLGRGRFPASGFVWQQGLVVTAEEALETDDKLGVVAADGRELAATLVGRDPSTDIALLRIDDSTVAPLPLEASAPLTAGNLVVAVGRGREGVSAHLGMVAVAGGGWRSQRGGEIDRLVRLDIRASKLIEGGAVIDAQGRAAGLLALGPRRGALLIPAATINRVATQLLATGRISRGYLGFALQPVRLDPQQTQALGVERPRGIMVMSVDPDGPGRRAGMHIGDVIAKWNSEPVHGVRDLARHLSSETVGQPVVITYLRGGEVMTATLTVAERPRA